VWLSGGRLRTRHFCVDPATHPATGEELWFNQAHLFHPSSLGAERYAAMRTVFADEDMPRNAYYGDGAPIETDVLREIAEAYEVEASAFDWQAGDVLLLDNMLVTHGRRPFSGDRSVLVAMGSLSDRIDPAVTAC
jgi:hypothetical protein